MAAPPQPPASTPSPYDQKESDQHARSLVVTTKAYRNEAFLMSREARTIRIICEFEETLQRLRHNGILGTFLFFGSARAMYRNDWEREVANVKKRLQSKPNPKEKEELDAKMGRLQKTEWLCEYMEKTEELARRLTEWAMSDELAELSSDGCHPGGHSLLVPNLNYLAEDSGAPPTESWKQNYVVSTGGGPGLMEAANKGAASVPGARSAGFAISLPFEKGLNPYVTPKLAFTFHYFFTRKYWMMYPCKVLIACPGGFGTFDELFESVTLKQTGKKPPFPIVLIGKKYWTTAVNWQYIADHGVISQGEVDSLCITDDMEEAFQFIRKSLIDTHVKSPCKRQAEGAESARKKMKSDATKPDPRVEEGGREVKQSPMSRPADV